MEGRRNIGVEMTLSRVLRDGWFMLLTASVFDAQYKGQMMSGEH